MSHYWSPGGLQDTLALNSAEPGLPSPLPHHPITCKVGGLGLEEDDSLWCDHAKTGPADLRTRMAVQSSVAILLMECARSRFGGPPR